jgi:hypothetical protein
MRQVQLGFEHHHTHINTISPMDVGYYALMV